MNIQLNGDRVATVTGVAPLASLLDHLHREVLPRGHVLTSVRLDERELMDLDPASTVIDADAGQSLEVSSNGPAVLLTESLVEMRTWMGRLELALTRCAGMVREGEAWSTPYLQCLEAFDVFIRYVHPAGPLLERAGRGRSPSVGQVGEMLRTLEKAFRRGDEIGVADALEYELAPLVRDWQRYLDAV